MANYKFLGPDDQALVKEGSVYRVYNGPGDWQFIPHYKKTMRKALKLTADQYAKVWDKTSNTRWVAVGPYFGFMKAYESTYATGTKIVLARDEYVRLVNLYTGQERIVGGPTMLYENVTDNFATMRLDRKKATYLDQETAAVISDKTTALLSLVTHCSPNITNTLYVPPPLTRVVEERKLMYIKPHEVFVIRDVNGATLFYDGADPSSVTDYRCPSTESRVPGSGNAFWLPPYSRIVRMRWSSYGQPPTTATSLTATSLTPSGSGTGTRRRQTFSVAVTGKKWNKRPKWWFEAGDFNKDENFWWNRGSGANLTNVVTFGTVIVSNEVGGGPVANLMSLKGTTTTKLNFGNLFGGMWTICSLTRYAGANRRTVLQGSSFYHGHFKGRTGVGYYGTKKNNTQVLVDIVEPVLEWVPMCATRASSPNNILVGDEWVGIADSLSAQYGGLTVNAITSELSDFAVAEVIVWDQAFTKAEMLDAMKYLKSRLADATMFWDQPSSLGNKDDTQFVTYLDKRMQRSFYNFEVRSQDNVKLLIQGTVYWQIVEPRRTFNGTADPEGDVWLRARSALIGVVSSLTWNDFMTAFNRVIENAYQTERLDSFYSDRGIALLGMDLLHYAPTDARTIASLNSLVKANTARILALARQRTKSEIRAMQITANLAMEANKTVFIQAKALNDRIDAETRGATEGGRKATQANAYLNGIATDFPDVADRVTLYKEHMIRSALNLQTKTLFAGSARIFLKPQGQNMTLLLPTNLAYSLPDLAGERRLEAGALAPPPPRPLPLDQPHVAGTDGTTVRVLHEATDAVRTHPEAWQERHSEL